MQKGYKIDVKSSCLLNCGNSDYYRFTINKNIVADYFIIFGFDNRYDLNLLIIWMIKGTEIIRRRKFNEFQGLSITNTPEKLKEFNKYELKDKLDKGIRICNEFKLRMNTKMTK